MKVLVITGGIGSGKSYACKYLHENYGWPVYEADSRVKRLYSEHKTLLSEIEVLLGRCFRDAERRFSPQLLASVIFDDPDALRKVESLVFPALSEDFEEWKKLHADKEVVILESATILEKPELSGMGDLILLIDAPVDVRLSRAVCRDGVSVEQVRSRMTHQTMMNEISEGNLQPCVDRVIINADSPEIFMQKLKEFAENIV